MKLALQYVSNTEGKPISVMLPVSDWKKILRKLKKYEETLKIKSDIEEAMSEVAELKLSKEKKQSLIAFLNEL